ncbi:1-acyl-sn-glycerol-3-phosphate acyltransferase [Nocardia inohanensis]|uniref:1-acyl-sn-glycerol-3-phosphate acyltransferase n=1 Tax=Nocardia inohanensis TaxID=209246 RepID=UPI0008304CD3|nr:1-acyl-sn-glycerol-3-phosphate acyltransferase [Nocardia inohanensis]
MKSPLPTAVLGGILLAAGAPLLLLTRLTLLLPGLSEALRNRVRLLLLGAAFLLVYEVDGRSAAEVRRTGRQGGCDRLAALNRRFYGWGFAIAGIELDCAPPPRISPDRPVIVLARHAGMFNSALMAHLIARDLGRDTYTIAKRCAAVTPGLRAAYADSGVVFCRFDEEGKARALQQLQRQATGALPSDALLLFPEGTNYSVKRWRQAIDDLRAAGRVAQAVQAEQCPHVMPVHPTGAWMLATSAPTADVVVLAQTGLEDLTGAKGLGYPSIGSGRVHVGWWHIPAGEVPRERAEFAAWLRGQWREVDTWIATARGTRIPEAVPPVDLSMPLRPVH